MTKPKKRRLAEQLRDTLRERQGGCCCYCHGAMRTYPKGSMPVGGYRPDGETLEHLRRRCEGGKTTPDNVALACFRCNSERGALDWFTYATWRAEELFV